MPLLFRSEFQPQLPPRDISPDDEVFYHVDTGEVFTAYADYLDRAWSYRRRLWSCGMTGRQGLTFREALESERWATERLEQQFRSEVYLEPLCRLAHHFPARLDDLVDAIAELFRRALMPGEAYVDGERELGTVHRVWIASDAAAAEAPAPLAQLRLGPDLAQAIVAKRVDFRLFRYELEDRRILPPPDALLSRKTFPVAKTILRQKVREVTVREAWQGAPFCVHDAALVAQYNLPKLLPNEEMRRAQQQRLEKKRRREQREEEAAAQEAPEERAERKRQEALEKRRRAREAAEQARLARLPKEDTEVDHSDDPPRPEPCTDFVVDRVSFGDLLMIWNFLTQFGRQALHLTPFSLDDFEGALAYPSGHSPLIDAVFAALLRLVLNGGGDTSCSRDLRDFLAASRKSGRVSKFRRIVAPDTWVQVLIGVMRRMRLPRRARQLFLEVAAERLVTDAKGNNGSGGEEASIGRSQRIRSGAAAAEDEEEQEQEDEEDHSLNGREAENDDLNDDEYDEQQQHFFSEPRSPLLAPAVIEAVLTMWRHGYAAVPLSGRLVMLRALCDEALGTERVRQVLDETLEMRMQVARATREELLQQRREIKEQIAEAEAACEAFRVEHGMVPETTGAGDEDEGASESGDDEEAEAGAASDVDDGDEEAEASGSGAPSDDGRGVAGAEDESESASYSLAASDEEADDTSASTSKGRRGGALANGHAPLATPDAKRQVRQSRREALAAERERRAQEQLAVQIEREYARLRGRIDTLQHQLRKERDTYDEQMKNALAEYSVRTGAMGLDRDHNRYWFFHGEGRLFIEQQPSDTDKPTWSYYATKADLDAFLLHLNDKGKREHALKRRLLRSYNWIVSAMRKHAQLRQALRAWEHTRSARTRQAPHLRLAWFRYENKLAPETKSDR